MSPIPSGPAFVPKGQGMDTADTPARQKVLLRQRMKEALAGLSTADIAAESLRALEQVPESRYWQRARSILSYVPFPRGEFDTGPLNRAAFDGGKRLLLPRTRGSAISMIPLPSHRDWRTGLVASPFKGLLEPPEDWPACPPEGVEGPLLVLVPGLAFDRHGRRLGRGLGCYDRLLTRLRHEAGIEGGLCALGMALEIQLVDEIPVDAYDVGLDALYCGGSILKADCSNPSPGF